MDSLKPPRLKKGDLIGLLSPASPPDSSEKIEGSVRYLESLGYRVKLGEHAAKELGYLAGTDLERAGDFNRMIRDPEVRAIFALRGGYGTPRILPLIDYKAMRHQPKIVCGFSDITALQLALYRKCRLVTFSGPMPAVEFWRNPDPYTEDNFWPLLTSTKKFGRLRNPNDEPLLSLASGKTAGILLGGNLALIVSTLATPFFPSLRHAVLVLEEVDEYPYRVDRMLTQLRNSGVAARIQALLLGKFTHCEPKDSARPFLPIDHILAEFSATVSGPVIGNLQYGHEPQKLTIPFGIGARVDASGPSVDLLEPAVA